MNIDLDDLARREAEPVVPAENSDKSHLDPNLARASLDGYAIEIHFDNFDKLFYVKIIGEPDMSVIGHGDTIEEAMDCLSVHLAIVLENEPEKKRKYSGQFNFRMPSDLHRQLAVISDKQKVSINQFILSAVAEKVGKVT